jgi:KDO2-lipid IV(A) lauroyltransferase
MSNWKSIRRRIRRPFETGGFVLFQWLIPLLPRVAVLGLSRMVGRIMWLLPLREKRIGLINLEAVFGDSKTPEEKRIILTSSFSTFAQTMLDVLWFTKKTEMRILKYVDIDPSTDPFKQDKAHICITAHYGNWETMGVAAAYHGIVLASIAATLKNKNVDKLFRQARERTGQTIIPQQGALRTLIARIRKKGKIAFVLDQNTEKDEGGILVNFLGLPMSVSSAPAGLAYRTGTEIILALCKPQEGGRYLIFSPAHLTPPAYDAAADTDRIVHELTQEIEDHMSKVLLANPEYWLWSYKHWRRKPGITYPPNYPQYDVPARPSKQQP